MPKTTQDRTEALIEFANRQLYEVILPWWMKNMPDPENGGFLAGRDHHNRPLHDHPRGLILNARILWAFSAAYTRGKNEKYLQLAHEAYHWLTRHFRDPEFGGYFWSVDRHGKMVNGKKQTYGQAFVMYALTEYAEISGLEAAAQEAENLFRLIEQKTFDPAHNGYVEAFSREWKNTADIRLSDIDMNEKKSMNTHLHVIEAYTRFYRYRPNDRVKAAILNLLDLFDWHIINHESHHLNLFFDEEWKLKSHDVSFGHDIEASWLLQEAAEIIHNPLYARKFKDTAVEMCRAVVPALIPEGGLIHESHALAGQNTDELEWWAQAEGIVGFLNAFSITGDDSFLDRASALAGYIEKYFIDRENGEWYYRVTREGHPNRFIRKGWLLEMSVPYGEDVPGDFGEVRVN